jgi:hypothetical protein
VLDPPARDLERLLLGIRLADGYPLAGLSAGARERAGGFVAAGLLHRSRTTTAAQR